MRQMHCYFETIHVCYSLVDMAQPRNIGLNGPDLILDHLMHNV